MAQTPLPTFSSASDMLADMQARLPASGNIVRNYVAVISPPKIDGDVLSSAFTVVTALFPLDALDFYTRFNRGTLDLDSPADKALYDRLYNPARGGGQGDYREGFSAKVENVVDCLTRFPSSKRATLTIPGRTGDHTSDDDAKCLRELHFFLDPVAGVAGDDRSSSRRPVLHCTGFMRAQAATIVPKNLHFIGSIIVEVAGRLGADVGTYTHFVTCLVDGRER
jgi:hypothetical protein